jgi:hypothetical protein
MHPTSSILQGGGRTTEVIMFLQNPATDNDSAHPLGFSERDQVKAELESDLTSERVHAGAASTENQGGRAGWRDDANYPRSGEPGLLTSVCEVI